MTTKRTEAEDQSAAQTVIRPTAGWVALNVRELWSYRELAYFFTWRDLKVRYKQTAFGALWAIIQPLAMMIIFTLVLGRVAAISPAVTPYPLFVFAGLVPWTLFSQSLITSSDSLVNASNLIQKVYFPRLILPISAVGSFLVDFGIGLGALVLLMLYFGVLPTPTFLWVLPLTGLAVATSLAVGIWLSAVNVRYRDVRHAVPFIVQVWLFASPVAYAADLIPQQWRAVYQLNPMAGVIEGFRWAVLGGVAPPPVESVVVSALASAAILGLGLAYFRRVERTFADVI
jgi:lipopolysaccharide transport system permease protein